MQDLDDEVAESHFLLTALGCSVPPCDVNSNTRGVEQAVEAVEEVEAWKTQASP